MFRGAIPVVVADIADEHIREWSSDTVYVGCSGSFTVERHLSQYGKTIHSNDVLLFSAAIGGYFSGKPYPIRLSEVGKEELPWIEPYLTDPASSLAALLAVSSIRDGDSPYYQMLNKAWQDQFPRLHAHTKKQLQEHDLKVASYTNEDVLTWIDKVPKDAAFVAYPPFQAGGAASYFARDFERLENVFEWEAPEYTMLEDEALTELYLKIADRKEWMFAVNTAVPELSDHLKAFAQTTNRAPRIHVYGSHGPLRLKTAIQKTQAPKVPHLTGGKEIGDHLAFAMLDTAQFHALRSVYMNKGIKPGSVLSDLPLAVLVDGVLVGALCYSFRPSWASFEGYLPSPVCYLLSDFPVSCSDYPRLSKLIVAASLSWEGQQIVQRFARRRYRSLSTTAFSKNPVSMKYRGILNLMYREHNDAFNSSYAENLPEGDPYYSRPWVLQYGGSFEDKKLDEILAWWKQKHGKRETA